MPRVEIDSDELVLLKRLERYVGAHFISPFMPEHMAGAQATLVDLHRLRERQRDRKANDMFTDGALGDG